jgi:hypothetical protein
MMKKMFFVLTAALFAFAGCGREAVEGPAAGDGQLDIDFSVVPEIAVLSTRGDVPGITTPTREMFDLVLYPQGGNIMTGLYYESIDDYDTEMWHGTGFYTARVSYPASRDGSGNPVTVEEGFDKPTFGATANFEVRDSEVTTVNLDARLTNVAITVEAVKRGDVSAFKNYFSDYSVSLVRGGSEVAGLTFPKNKFSEDGGAVYAMFVNPAPFQLKLTATRQSTGKPYEKIISIDNVAACTHYRVKYDVNEGAVGGATIVITWDDSVEAIEEPIDINVGE